MDATLDQLSVLTKELVDYGPYALLAIFLLYIAPKHTKRFIDCEETDSTKRRLLCSIASGNWLVVFVMCVYIYTNWSPTKVYEGSLGIHGEESEFFTIDPNSYIATNEVRDKIEWLFAFVSESGAIKKNDRFRFIHEYKGTPLSYAVPASALKSGKIHITANSANPSQLMIDMDNDPDTASVPLKPTVASFESPEPSGGFMAAYAAPAPTDHAAIIRQLSSSNRYFQAMGRRKLQAKTIQELQLMMSTPNIPQKAKREIQTVISRR
jgi:hypothetical protein